MPIVSVHLVFDLLASATAVTVTWLVYRWRLCDRVGLIERAGPGYAAALLIGAAVGGYGLGTANLFLSGQPGVGRSIIGALLGAIVAIEGFKLARGLRGSTGLIFVPGLCATIVIGRIGCLLTGVADFTYGTPTNVAWAWDFGDGIPRHPVPLYESAAMGIFLLVTVIALRRRSPLFLRNGFYFMTAWYAVQRYGWEFLKPYGTVWGGHTVFQLAAVVLLVYSLVMIGKGRHDVSVGST